MATIPKNAKKPTDRKPAERRKAEAEAGQFYEATINGHTFRVCHPDDWYLTAVDKARNNDILGWAREGGIHPDDVEEFLAAKLRVREAADLMDGAMEYFGADQGE